MRASIALIVIAAVAAACTVEGATRPSQDRPCTSSASVPASQAAIDSRTATLQQALENWISLLEDGQQAKAVKLWSATPKAGDEMSEMWAAAVAAHNKYDYRKWISQVKGDEDKFTVGGHVITHLHIDWIKTQDGWRIRSVWKCR